jgi:hypothetical protein
MPSLPVYNQQRNISSGVGAAPRDTATAQASVNNELINAASDITQKWNNAVDTIQATSAVTKFNTAVLDIKTRAENDPDINSYPKYKKELDNARKESLKGFQNKMVEEKVGFSLLNDANVADASIGNTFRTRQIQFGQAELLKGVDALTQRNVNAINAADAQKSEQDLSDMIAANVKAGVINADDGYKLLTKTKAELPVLRANKAINDNPVAAQKLLEENAFGIEDASKRRELINLAKSFQKMDDYEMTKAKFQNRIDVVAKIANGEINFQNSQGVIMGLSETDNELAESMKTIFNKRGKYVTEDPNNQGFQDLMYDVFKQKDSEGLGKVLVNILGSEKQISRDRLSVLVEAARMRSEYLNTKSGKGGAQPNFLDSAVSFIKESGSSFSVGNIFMSMMKRITSENVSGEQIMSVATDEVRKQRLIDNPTMASLPKEGTLHVDRFGNKAIVYPDGTYKEVMSGEGDYIHKEQRVKK